MEMKESDDILHIVMREVVHDFDPHNITHLWYVLDLLISNHEDCLAIAEAYLTHSSINAEQLGSFFLSMESLRNFTDELETESMLEKLRGIRDMVQDVEMAEREAEREKLQ